MPFRIDTSPLYMPPRPSALSQGLGQVGDIMTAMMERRRLAERQAIEDQQKQAELEFRRGQEQRLTERQTKLDEREEQRLTRQDQQQSRNAIAEAYTKNPQSIPAIAQLYGGSVAPKKPNYTNEADPLGPEIPMLSDVKESDSYLGFEYGMNPEHERRTQEAAGKQVVTMPGMEPMELPAQQAQASHIANLRSVFQGMPQTPETIMALRSLQEAEALGFDPEATGRHVNAGRAFAQRDAMQDERLAAQKRRGGGGPAGAAKDKTDDLEVPNLDGSVAGLARTPKEAEDARKDRTVIEKAQKTAEALKQHLKTVGRINMFKGNSGEQKSRNTLIGSLIEARVKLTGALNLGDVDLAKDQFDTSLRASGDDAAKAVDLFMQNLVNDYEAKKKSIISRPAAGTAPAAQGAQGGGYGPVTTKTTKQGETVKVRKNLSTGQWEEVE